MEDLKWIRSSYSNGNGGGNCVEVAGLGVRRAVRDSKHPNGPTILVDGGSWSSFILGIQRGELDHRTY